MDSDLLELLPSCSWSGGRVLTPLLREGAHVILGKGLCIPWSLGHFIFLLLFVYFWLCWVFFAAHRLSLVAASGDYSLVAVRGLLIEVASLVELSGVWAQHLQLLNSRM